MCGRAPCFTKRSVSRCKGREGGGESGAWPWAGEKRERRESRSVGSLPRAQVRTVEAPPSEAMEGPLPALYSSHTYLSSSQLPLRSRSRSWACAWLRLHAAASATPPTRECAVAPARSRRSIPSHTNTVTTTNNPLPSAPRRRLIQSILYILYSMQNNAREQRHIYQFPAPPNFLCYST